jgi:outer membrane protein assembly factor BamB
MTTTPASSIVVSAFGGRIFGLSTQTGEPAWMYETESTGQTHVVRIAIEGERIYALSKSELVCLDYKSGNVVWKTEAAAGDLTLLVGPEGVFTAGDGEVRCFALDSGEPRWQQRFPGMGRGSVAIGLPGAASQADRT